MHILSNMPGPMLPVPSFALTTVLERIPTRANYNPEKNRRSRGIAQIREEIEKNKILV